MTHLFLDFDGVLHPVWVTWDFKSKDLFCFVPLLAKLLKPYSVAVVVSSDWRRLHSIEQLTAYLGPQIGRHVVGTTPVLVAPRWAQIAAYIAAERVIDWIAIDDDTDGWPEGMQTHLVATDPQRGLGDRAAQARLSEVLLRRSNG